MPSVMDGRTGYWLRQFGDTSERTLARILETVTGLGGGNMLVQKVADGTTWQGQIDAATPIRSYDDIHAFKRACETAGVLFCPVVVPRGRDPYGEAAMHANIANIAGLLMTDIEPYPGFFDGAPRLSRGERQQADMMGVLSWNALAMGSAVNRPVGASPLVKAGVLDLIPVYTGELRRLAPGAYLVNQPDPREWAMKDAKVAETAGDFDGIAAQHYVGWDSVGWTNVQAEVRRYQQLAGLGREMHVTLYGVEGVQRAAEFWRIVREMGCRSVHTFALGPMNASQLQWFGGLPKPVIAQPEPEPIPDPEPVEDPDAAIIAALRLGLEQAERDRDDYALLLALVRQVMDRDFETVYASVGRILGRE